MLLQMTKKHLDDVLFKLNLLFRYFFSDKYYLSSCKCVVLNAVQTCHKTSCTEAKNHSKNETE